MTVLNKTIDRWAKEKTTNSDGTPINLNAGAIWVNGAYFTINLLEATGLKEDKLAAQRLRKLFEGVEAND